MSPLGPALAVNDVVLQRLGFMVRRHLSDVLMVSAVSMETFIDHELEALVVALRYDVMGERVKMVEHRDPKDWRWAVYERWAPEWMKRRWPVKYLITTLEAKAIYPWMAIPEEGRVVLSKYTREAAT